MGSSSSKQWSSDYDSTWEEEERPPERMNEARRQKGSKAARDMQNYRHGYPHGPEQENFLSHTMHYHQILMARTLSSYLGFIRHQQSIMMQVTPDSSVVDMMDIVLRLEERQRQALTHPVEMVNLAFYQNRIPCQPGGLYIDELLERVKESTERLEDYRDCIQWLFPLREHKMSLFALPLTSDEIQMMKADEDVMQRILDAYRCLLAFYGIQLMNSHTGEVVRARNWKERFAHLKRVYRNRRCITRMLKCLGELGYDHFQTPLVRFFLEESLCHGNLPEIKTSVLNYYLFSVKNKKERRKLVHFAWQHYKPQDHFIWGPVDILQTYKENGDMLRDCTGEDDDDNMKEPGREDSEDDMKEPGREDSEDDMKEPVREDSDDDMKEPVRENSENDMKFLGQKTI
ncbi:opioid growth factor receptor-like [Hyperolius riggenbachi]|uniref:opioid growth factor receptor-like n=1 Tax=Hyperolius riggenbachi TaxID=752182 RepID=UPI0035A36AE0